MKQQLNQVIDQPQPIYKSQVTGALHVNKPEATGIVIIARWPLKNNLNLNIWLAQVLHTKI